MENWRIEVKFRKDGIKTWNVDLWHGSVHVHQADSDPVHEALGEAIEAAEEKSGNVVDPRALEAMLYACIALTSRRKREDSLRRREDPREPLPMPLGAVTFWLWMGG